MKGLVMEVRDGYSAVFREDGVVVKIRQSCQVGETIELPEARNALNAISAGVGALGAKLSRGKSVDDAQSFDATAEAPRRQAAAPTPRADADATEIISDTVRDALDDAPSAPGAPEPVSATGIISDTVRDALDAPKAETVRDASGNQESETVWDAPDAPETETVWDSPDNEPTVRFQKASGDAPAAPVSDAQPAKRRSAPAVTLWKEAVAAQAASGESKPALSDSDIQAAATEITSNVIWDGGATETASGVRDGAPTQESPKAQKADSRRTIRFPVGLNVLESVKERVNAVKESVKAGDGKTKGRKNPWIQGAIAAALALVILSGSVTYNTAFAASYVSIDVDESSFELAINRMGRVIAVKPISSDAQGLARSIEGDVKNKRVDDAVSRAMDTLKDAGYLDSANGEIIASVTANSEKRGMELTQTVAQTMEGRKSDGVKLYLMEASRGDRGAALARKISPGRYLIQRSGMDTRPPRNDDFDASAVQVNENPALPAPPDTPDFSAVDALPQTGTVTLSNGQTGAAATSDSGATANASGVPATAADSAVASATPATPTTTDNGATQTPATATTPAPAPDAGNAQSPATSAQTPATTNNTTTNNNKTSNTTTNSNKTNSNKTNSNKTTSNNKTASKNNASTSSKSNTKTTTTTPKPQETKPNTAPAVQPTPTVEPQPEPAPTVTPAPQPEPAPVAPSEPESKPVQQPEPEPESKPVQRPEPEPESKPVQQPESKPAPEPEPETRFAEREPEETWKAPETKPSNGGQKPSDGGGQSSGGDAGETTGQVVRENKEPVRESRQPDDGETTAPKPSNNGGGESKPANEAPRQSEPEPVRETPRQSEPEPVREAPRQSEPEPVREAPRQSEPEPVRETPRQSEPEPVREAPRQSEPEPVREAPRQSEPEPEAVSPSNNGGGGESQSAPPSENPENEAPM